MNFELYTRLWGYEYVFENAHTSERDNEAMLDLVSRNHRFNQQQRNGPLQCRCRRPFRCGEEWCLNRTANFECSTCVDCDNQQLSRPGSREPPVMIDNNPGYGMSLFATRKIVSKEYVGEMKGQYVTHRLNEDNPRSLYSFRIVTEESKDDDRVFTLDLTRYANEFKFASHNCNANMETFLVKVGAEVRIGVRAIREIQQGDLLTLNFGKDFFRHGLVCFCDTCCEGGGLAGERALAQQAARQEARASRGGRGVGRRRQTLQVESRLSMREGLDEPHVRRLRRGRSRPLRNSMSRGGGRGRNSATRGRDRGRSSVTRGTSRASVGEGRGRGRGRGRSRGRGRATGNQREAGRRHTNGAANGAPSCIRATQRGRGRRVWFAS